jgi:hypothetical protein
MLKAIALALCWSFGPASPVDDVLGLSVDVVNHYHNNSSSDGMEYYIELQQAAGTRWDLTIMINSVKVQEIKNVAHNAIMLKGADYATQFHARGEVSTVVVIAVCRNAPIWVTASEASEHP